MYRRRRLGPPLGLAAMLVLLDVLLWMAVINGIFTGIGWLFEKPETRR